MVSVLCVECPQAEEDAGDEGVVDRAADPLAGRLEPGEGDLEGVEPDLVTAYAWMILAAGNGQADARGRMPLLQSELTAGQILDAQKLAVTLGRATRGAR